MRHQQKCILVVKEKEVVVFCRNLQRDVFENQCINNAIKSAIDKGVSIRILLQQDPESQSIINMKSEGLLISMASEEDKQRVFNFCVKDKESLRWEEDRKEVKAYASMYRPSEATTLHQNFELMWRRALPI